MALGAGTGLAVGLSQPRCLYDTLEEAFACAIADVGFPRGPFALTLAIAGGLGGGAAGAALGAAVGSRRTYRIEPPHAAPPVPLVAGDRDPG
jgi:hypothetical protein